VCAIVESCPPRRTLLFSATMPEPVRKLARSIQTDAVEVLCDERVETHTSTLRSSTSSTYTVPAVSAVSPGA
ncbi:MAG TPA: hypothetical protein QGF58_06100, partial [Myxococcota bacterium]|nr:hypothetical protein [Myxococcota bacterium]